MQSTSFLCPYDAVYKIIHVILQRKGYTILSAENINGVIKAEQKKTFFKRTKLKIKIYKIDQTATGLTLSINNNEKTFDRATTQDEVEEQKLLDTINKTF